MIQSINYQLRKVTKTRGHFPTDDALLKLLYLACREMGRTNRAGQEADPATTGKQPSTSSTSCSPVALTGPNINTRSGAYTETLTPREQQLPPVRLTVGPAADLRALLDYRDDLVHERGALVNRAHAELGGLRAGYQRHIPTLSTGARVRAALELLGDEDSVRAVLCRRRLERVIAIDTETADLKRQIAGLVAAADTTLTDRARNWAATSGRL
jgi:hypothetical protein